MLNRDAGNGAPPTSTGGVNNDKPASDKGKDKEKSSKKVKPKNPKKKKNQPTSELPVISIKSLVKIV